MFNMIFILMINCEKENFNFQNKKNIGELEIIV